MPDEKLELAHGIHVEIAMALALTRRRDFARARVAESMAKVIAEQLVNN
jgi:hypothetical protein